MSEKIESHPIFVKRNAIRNKHNKKHERRRRHFEKEKSNPIGEQKKLGRKKNKLLTVWKIACIKLLRSFDKFNKQREGRTK